MMTEDKLREVIEKLETILRRRPATAAEWPYIEHLLTMPDHMLLFLAEGRREKLMRWVGFMQGALWMMGIDLEELKKMNMPDEEKPKTWIEDDSDLPDPIV